VQLYFKLNIHTGIYSPGFWCSSASGYILHPGTYSQVSWCSSISGIHTHRNLLLGNLVQLYFKLYIHTLTYSQGSWCSSISSYTYTQELTLSYLGAALFQAIYTHRNLLSGILVQLYFNVYRHTVTKSQASWCSSASSYTYPLEPIHKYLGGALF